MAFTLMVIAGVVALSVHKHKKRKGRRAVYDYSNVRWQEVMAMLVHCGYFRHLNPAADVAATYLGYQNPRAENYGERHWQPLPDSLAPRWTSKSEAKSLGLHFFFRTHPTSSVPQLAIILRGTIPYRFEDLTSDFVVALQHLHSDKRVDRTEELILEVVRVFRARCGERGGIRMAGHSLGSAIAFQVGKRLYLRHGININTHLFSSPMLTVRDIVTLKAFERSHVQYTVRSGNDYSELWGTMLNGNQALRTDWANFHSLQGWAPHYYLNRSDPLCRLFIKYFTEGAMAQTAVEKQRFFSHLFSQNPKLIPNVPSSAHVRISDKYSGNPIKGHNLRQWHKFTDEELSLKEFYVNLVAPVR